MPLTGTEGIPGVDVGAAVVGVAVGTTQIQLLWSTQLGFLQNPELQIIVDGQLAFVVHALLHASGGVGVALGVTVGVGTHVQLLCVTQLGFLQNPELQIIVDGQLALVVHALLHASGGVGVVLGEGSRIENTSLHAGATACGVTCGTVGAMGVFCSSLTDVR